MLTLHTPFKIVLDMNTEILTVHGLLQRYSHHCVVVCALVRTVCDSHDVTLLGVKTHSPYLGPVHETVKVVLKYSFVFRAFDGPINQTVISEQADCAGSTNRVLDVVYK